MTIRDIQAPMTMEEPLVTTLATSDALVELLIEKGADHAGGVDDEDFGGAGCLPADAKTDGVVRRGVLQKMVQLRRSL